MLPDAADRVSAAPAWAASAAAGRLSLTLRPPAWQQPVPEQAAAPLVVIGHAYVGPGDAPQPELPPAVGWTAGLPPDDPFARLLAGLAQGASEDIWLS